VTEAKFKRLLEIVYGIETGHSTPGELEEAVGILRNERNDMLMDALIRQNFEKGVGEVQPPNAHKA